MHPLVYEFMCLFEGHQSSYGTYTLTGEISESGKAKGNAVSINKEIRVEDYHNHLMGKKGLGVIPINAKSMSRFGAIDIDEYPLNLYGVRKKIEKANLPLVVCRTKSGGAHLYLFLRDWAPSGLVQKKLREMAVFLGYGTCEIYPRQSQLIAERGDAGNWINLPYFDASQSLRYALSEKDKALSLEAFLQYANSKSIDQIALHNTKYVAPESLPGGPPCLQQLCQQGFPDGTRNNGLLNLGIFAQKAYGENWEARIEEYNRKYMNPPLSPTEVLGVIKSLKKKTYSYTCKAQPIQSFCNAAICRTCKFGVGGADLGMPKFGTLTKLNTIPPIWFLDVEKEDGVGRLELSTEELQNPIGFQKRCMEALNIMPMILKRETWSGMIQKLLQEVNVVDIPAEATPAGQMLQHLEMFCTSRVEARFVDELLLGKPWRNDKEIHFRLSDFLNYLQMKKFNLLPLNKIASHLKDVTGYRKQFHNIKGKGVNVIVVAEELFEVQNESLTVPEQPKEVL